MGPSKPRRSWLLVLLLSGAIPAASAQAQIRLQASAAAGRPFGVGLVEITLPRSQQPEALGLSGLAVTEAGGRVLYPAVDASELGPVLKGVKDVLQQSRRPLGRLFGEILDAPPKAKIYFLFQGDAPLELTVHSRRADALTLTPRPDAGAHRRLLDAWWRQYTQKPGLLAELFAKPDYPPQVESYLQTMLAHRLGVALPEKKRGDSFEEFVAEELGLLMGTESVRVAVERDRFLRPMPRGEIADRPLPEPVDVPPLEVPPPPDGVEVEPIAQRVPEECLYVRFGSFANFLWLQDMLATWRGDLQNLVALRGLDYEVKRRLEESLVLQQTALARLLGPTTVADVAIVGTDLSFHDGGAFGLLFHARNNLLLGADFQRQRQERLAKGDDATEEKIDIAGREVSFLSSSDGSVRSYYAVDGDFHFVTRSKTLVRRFLETGSGEGALGRSDEFRHVRTVMPLARQDTVFVYISDAFFRNFVGPHYRVESVRRMQAVADVELVQLALLASATEGKPGDTIDELVRGGFLPRGFGARPDGTQAVLDDGDVYDSLRGYRGALVPIPDVEVDRVSPSETRAYRQFAEFYRSNWQRLDPIAVALKREALADNRQRIVIDARMTPFARQNHDRLRRKLGPPDAARLAPVSGDGIAAEAVLAEQRLFGGLQEIRPPSLPLLDPASRELGGLRNVFIGYLGAVGPLGPLNLLNLGIPARADAAGYASSPAGMWRRQYGEFTVFSFQPEVLAAVTPQLRFEEAERPAQIRLRIEDVSQGRIAPMLNNMGYARTRETTLGNLRLMQQIAQQLHVPGEHCQDAAELLLDARLVCPLGGQYVWQPTGDGWGHWTSTALVDHPTGGLLTTSAPEGFVAPPLSWFRGLKLDVEVTPDVLSAHADLIMQMPAAQSEN